MDIKLDPIEVQLIKDISFIRDCIHAGKTKEQVLKLFNF